MIDEITIEDKAIELLAAKANLTIPEYEDILKSDAVTVATKSEIAEVVKRIRNQKVDEAKAYQPTDEEIITALEAKIPEIVPEL